MFGGGGEDDGGEGEVKIMRIRTQTAQLEEERKTREGLIVFNEEKVDGGQQLRTVCSLAPAGLTKWSSYAFAMQGNLLRKGHPWSTRWVPAVPQVLHSISMYVSCTLLCYWWLCFW